MRTFSSVRAAARVARPGSKPSRSTGMAPPCTRRRRPWPRGRSGRGGSSRSDLEFGGHRGDVDTTTLAGPLHEERLAFWSIHVVSVHPRSGICLLLYQFVCVDVKRLAARERRRRRWRCRGSGRGSLHRWFCPSICARSGRFSRTERSELGGASIADARHHPSKRSSTASPKWAAPVSSPPLEHGQPRSSPHSQAHCKQTNSDGRDGLSMSSTAAAVVLSDPQALHPGLGRGEGRQPRSRPRRRVAGAARHGPDHRLVAP